MRKLPGMLASIALLITASAFASDPEAPNFAAYAVPVATPAKMAAPVLVTKPDHEFRTMIRRAAHDGKVNFAGHYILSAIGCGSSCLLAFALDANDGQVTWLPFTVSFTSELDHGFNSSIQPFDFHADSRLLVIQGSRDEHDDDGIYQYVFEHNRFHLVHAKRYRSVP